MTPEDEQRGPGPGDALGAALRAALDQVQAALRPLDETAAEARGRFMELGFTEEAACLMAAEYYRVVIGVVTRGLRG